MAARQTPGTRAKDSDRNDTCQILDSALSEGQLSMEEHRQRVSAATHAATLGELQTLVADLQTSNAPVQLPTLKAPSRVRPPTSPAPISSSIRAAIRPRPACWPLSVYVSSDYGSGYIELDGAGNVKQINYPS